MCVLIFYITILTNGCSLPGGRRDPEDKTIVDTALRETYEEIDIHPSEIEILGQHAALPSVDKSLIIYPIVGYIKQPVDVHDIKYNHHEVSDVFTLTLDELLNPTNRTKKRFRDTNYYYTVSTVYEKLCKKGSSIDIDNHLIYCRHSKRHRGLALKYGD